MKLLIWLDIACPYCHIGKTNLDRALKEMDAEVEVEYKSFRLNPTAPAAPDFTMKEELAGKYGKSGSEVDEMLDQLAVQGKEAGITFNMDGVIPSNTMDAHRLIKFAAADNKDDAVLKRLYTAYFEAGRNTSDHGVLLEIAEDAGLEAEAVRDMLESDLYKDLIYADQNEAKDIGVQGVPFIVVNGEYALPGAMRTEDYLRALQEVQESN
ncbi:DsbA family oxidoreductase [Salinicoccus kekensis]|uniref:Predicted DsbA family dithiol-disulfide isomerase n=1 Tax=Salinicoccus kekensis TaxID=714307 RepID=A0A285UT38_9STAP|nr:DsbA family oxidoreductase [Salinicoccus kekensis]SOC44548.1 predicted DsbA family dithiol-disulfide isomerase [Salinicoccus kekensis]